MNNFKKITAFILSLTLVLIPLNAEKMNNVKAESSSVIPDGEYSAYKAGLNYPNSTEELVLADGDYLTADKQNGAEWSFDTKSDSKYNIKLVFAPTDENTNIYKYSLFIDNSLPFKSCEELKLRTYWEDDGGIRTLTNGDQVNPLQKCITEFTEQTVSDPDGIENSPYEFMLSAGRHTIKIVSLGKAFKIQRIILSPVEEIKKYSEVSQEYKNYKNYDGKQIVIEAENALYKNEYSLTSKSDNSTAGISPSSPTNSLINYIGGTNWKEQGTEIVWNLDVKKDGLYKVGFAFKQSYVTDGLVYRNLKIDGKTPFYEAGNIPFAYSSKWQFEEFKDEEGNDYLIYLTAGSHKLSLSVTLSDTAEVFKRLKEVISALGDLYLDIVMITGEDPDTNRDYELHKQIPEFEETLTDSLKKLNALSKDLNGNLKVNGELNGAVKNMSRVVKNMLDNVYDAHLQVKNYYTAQQTLSTWLYDIKNMSLALDQIILASPQKEFDTPKAGFLERLKFFIIRYSESYSKNSSTITSSKDKSLDNIKIWVNWGRDQVKVLNSLIQDSFTPKYGINVTVEQVNATLVQGVISGNSPDLYLHMARTEPVNLAMRGVLYNLRNFDDYEKVLEENFQKGSDTPYLYKDGAYALPDTQNFFVMFYRTDIFDKLGLNPPKIWEDFLAVTGILQRNKMNAYLPYTKLGAAGTVNIGTGGLTIFPTMLIQRGESLYNKEFNATNLASPISVEAFKFWTEFYTDYSLDQDANFFQKFRVGTIPMGIASYTQCLTFSAGAPEIAGKWSIAEIPGIAEEDGSINNICSGAGTGASIMKSSKNKDAAWNFLKWWTSSETQYRYSSDVEAILGETGRVGTANKNALPRLVWEDNEIDVITSQWSKLREIPEVPGSYYVSRSIDQAFWATKNGNKSAKESIVHWSEESNNEIARKIKEYANKEQ